MNRNLVFSLLSLVVFSCGTDSTPLSVSSPDGRIQVSFHQNQGSPVYAVTFNGKTVIDSSGFGFDFKDQPSLADNLFLTKVTRTTFKEEWEQPWGEQKIVLDEHNELKIELKEKSGSGRMLNIIFRVFNDGYAFRYEFPEQSGWTEAIITDENSEFNLTGDHTTWWIPGDWDIYEHLYTTSKFSEIDATVKRNHPALAQTYIPENAVNTPVTMRTADGTHLSFHEADLTDYAGLTLKVDAEHLLMTSELVGSDINNWKVRRTLPFETPWRMVLITEKATELIDSRTILNLNKPNKLGDVSWFRPTKYTGIWWEMHLGKSSWDMASGKHGATTANAKELIDFNASHGIGALLVEGWNTGWEHWIGFEDREGVFDFVTPYGDYDLDEVVRYADEKGVKLIMHHETSSAPRTYEKQMDTAYALMQHHGIHTVKTGYVGRIIPTGEYHHGQWMVNHYRLALETAARYNVAINAHEPIKATGIRRTLPNAISREGLRGQEFNAWSPDGGNPAEHLSIVAFTRMLAGPVDFTPGVFNIKFDEYKKENQVNTTLAHQLALYVVLYSPVVMACDLIEHYEDQPAFRFIEQVDVDWEQTLVLNGEVGDFVTIARKSRDTNDWFVGGITDETARDQTLKLDFLEEGRSYTAHIYRDDKDAHWDSNPLAIVIEKQIVRKGSQIPLHLAEGGGFAISLIADTF